MRPVTPATMSAMSFRSRCLSSCFLLRQTCASQQVSATELPGAANKRVAVTTCMYPAQSHRLTFDLNPCSSPDRLASLLALEGAEFISLQTLPPIHPFPKVGMSQDDVWATVTGHYVTQKGDGLEVFPTSLILRQQQRLRRCRRRRRSWRWGTFLLLSCV